MNPNTPIVVGVAHVAQRVTDPLKGKEATDLMVDAVEKAAADAGCPTLLSSVNSVVKNPVLVGKFSEIFFLSNSSLWVCK